MGICTNPFFTAVTSIIQLVVSRILSVTDIRSGLVYANNAIIPKKLTLTNETIYGTTITKEIYCTTIAKEI